MDALLLAATAIASPRSLRCLSHASSAVHVALSPVAKRSARALELRQALSRLPLQLRFPMATLSQEGLAEAVQHLKSMKMLRWREKVAQLAGWAPTEEETWTLDSRGAFLELLAVTRRVLQAAQAARPLLFGATLRRTESGFAPMAFEWAEGPAADPLQLAVALEPPLRLEMSSGGWSDWSQSWSVDAGTLRMELSMAIALPTGHLLWQHGFEGQQAQLYQQGPPQCLTQEAAMAMVPDKALAVLSLSGISWCGEAPPWRPTELRRLETRMT